MENDHKKPMKVEGCVWHEQSGHSRTSGGLSSVDKLREYYDGARNKLKTVLGREDAMGSGSSSPRTQDEGGGGGGCDGGVMFQQRPAHCRLEGKQVLTGEEFTDISYSDLGFIITPHSKILTVNNNNYPTGEENTSAAPAQSSPTPSTTPTVNTEFDLDSECDFVSTNLGSGKDGVSSSVPSSTSSNTNNNNNNNANTVAVPSTNNPTNLQHRSSNASFTLSHLPGAASEELPISGSNVEDLLLEEIIT